MVIKKRAEKRDTESNRNVPDPTHLVEEEETAGEMSVRSGGASYKPVGAILAGLSVLRYMASVPSPEPLSKITRNVGLNPSTCLNILRTLAAEDYLMFEPNSKLYSMGLGVLELVNGALAQGGDLRAVRAATDLIANAEDVTVTLWRRVPPDQIVLVLQSLPMSNLTIKLNVGQQRPLLVGATGRVMAAFSRLTEQELAQLFQQTKPAHRVSFREFMIDLERTRERGWATSEGHYTDGAAAIAIPVLGDSDEVLYAFSATMFSGQYSPQRAEALAAELARPAALLRSALPYL